ncbi:hypothetical protein GOC13_07770 [Sinorhizobium meliloti]|nr:hypothetical protein [Sinorhizobium meliloti]
MQIFIKFSDDEVELPEQGKVPVVAVDMKSKESVEGMSEPTPAMWTAACVYELFVTGKLNELTQEFIASKKTAISDMFAKGQGEGESV